MEERGHLAKIKCVARMKRKYSDSTVHRIKGDTSKPTVQRIRVDTSKRRVIPINVADPVSFTVQFCMRKDPNQEGTRAYSILFGILPKERIQEFFDVDEENDLPTHGFFVDDVFHLWGQDGTNRKLQVRGEYPDLCIEVGHPFRLTYRSEPFPHMLGELTNAAAGMCFTIDFDTGIPRGDYRLCVVFPGIGDGDFVMDASEKGMPDGEMFKLWTNRDFPDAEIVCQGKKLSCASSSCCPEISRSRSSFWRRNARSHHFEA